jgi:hypothetical protein
MSITAWARLGDFFAIPFFAALVVYFWQKPLRTEVETGFLAFALVGLLLDLFFVANGGRGA